MKQENCACCCFWRLDRDMESCSINFGVCKRMPPSFIPGVDAFKEGEKHDPPYYDHRYWHQPITCERTWCGEFKQKDTPATAAEPVDTLFDLLPNGIDGGIRARNLLIYQNIITIEDLLNCSETDLMRLPNCGRKSTNLIIKSLASRGLKLKE